MNFDDYFSRDLERIAEEKRQHERMVQAIIDRDARRAAKIAKDKECIAAILRHQQLMDTTQ